MHASFAELCKYFHLEHDAVIDGVVDVCGADDNDDAGNVDDDHSDENVDDTDDANNNEYEDQGDVVDDDTYGAKIKKIKKELCNMCSYFRS